MQRLIKKHFTGKQTGTLVTFCEAFEKRFGTDGIRNVRVSAVGKDNEMDSEVIRIQGKLRAYTHQGYVRNIAVEEDKTGAYFVIACDTAKIERISATSITLQYPCSIDASEALEKIRTAGERGRVYEALENLEFSFSSDSSESICDKYIELLPDLLRCDSTIRESSVNILKQIRTKRAAELLMDLMEDKSASVRRAAIMDAESLLEIISSELCDRLVSILLVVLNDSDECTRIYAAEALGFAGGSPELGKLCDCENDAPDVQWAAIGAIATIFPETNKDDYLQKNLKIDRISHFLTTVMHERSKKKAIRNTAALAMGRLMTQIIKFELTIDQQMKAMFEALAIQATNPEVESEVRSAAARQLELVTEECIKTNPDGPIPKWLYFGGISSIVGHLVDILDNPWYGRYCPILNDRCMVRTEKKNQCIIMYRYTDEGEAWREIVSEVIKQAGINPVISRELSIGSARGSHCKLICQPIRSSIMGIADISIDSTNVGYEIQTAWMHNRPLILTFQRNRKEGRSVVPFDFQGLHIVYYRNLSQLRGKLEEKVGEVVRELKAKYIL